MFVPSPSKAQRRQLSYLRAQLLDAMQASGAEAPPEAAPMQARRAELLARQQVLRGASDLAQLEAAAGEINLLQTQVQLLDGRLAEVQRAHETARQKQEAAGRSLCITAIELLSEVAEDFHRQHREHLANFIADYGGQALAARLVALIPWVSAYRARTHNFRYQLQVTSDKALLTYLDAALREEDFLMPPRS
jgi:hypothetical protein